MENKLFVGNLPWEATGDDLTKLFAEFGEVVAARIVTDKFSGRSRGFGFVEMVKAEDAQAAIKALDGKDYMGRPLVVNVSKPRE